MAIKGLVYALPISIIAYVLIALALAGAVSSGTICEEDMACWNCETMGNGVCGK